MGKTPREVGDKAQEANHANATTASQDDVSAALPLIENLPFPVMRILSDHEIAWMNQAGMDVYGARHGKCYAVTHSYEDPCNLHGEPCPKIPAERDCRPSSVLHVHRTTNGQERFKVIALPVESGGVLEWHIPLDDVSAVDSVTGLLTRTEAEQAARRMFALMVRMKLSFAMVMVDIDYFKLVNDQHGHLIGDRVLAWVSRMMSQGLRETDILGRWGGEEFLMVLPDIDRANAISTIERILQSVRTNSAPVNGENLTVTISAGLRWVSDREVQMQTFDALIRDADAALYRAKNEGRDQCVVHTTP